MKQLLTLAVLGLFGAALAGCEASAKVGDPDTSSSKTTTVRSSDSGNTYKKTTTTVEPDGDRTTRTEVKVDR
jgi:hypothetical protein